MASTVLENANPTAMNNPFVNPSRPPKTLSIRALETSKCTPPTPMTSSCNRFCNRNFRPTLNSSNQMPISAR